MLIYLFFSFWLHSVWQTISRLIHIFTNDTPPKKFPFYGWVIFHYIYVLYLLYPFTSQWIFRLLPCPGCCKYCCNEHWGTYVFWNYGFLWLYTQEWDCCVLSIGTSAGSEQVMATWRGGWDVTGSMWMNWNHSGSKVGRVISPGHT